VHVAYVVVPEGVPHLRASHVLAGTDSSGGPPSAAGSASLRDYNLTMHVVGGLGASGSGRRLHAVGGRGFNVFMVVSDSSDSANERMPYKGRPLPVETVDRPSFLPSLAVAQPLGHSGTLDIELALDSAGSWHASAFPLGAPSTMEPSSADVVEGKGAASRASGNISSAGAGTARSGTLTGLSPGQQYLVCVVATTPDGETQPGPTCFPRAMPPPPPPPPPSESALRAYEREKERAKRVSTGVTAVAATSVTVSVTLAVSASVASSAAGVASTSMASQGPAVLPMVFSFQRYALISQMGVDGHTAHRESGEELEWVKLRFPFVGGADSRRRRRGLLGEGDSTTGAAWKKYVNTVCSAAVIPVAGTLVHILVLNSWEQLASAKQAAQKLYLRLRNKPAGKELEGQAHVNLPQALVFPRIELVLWAAAYLGLVEASVSLVSLGGPSAVCVGLATLCVPLATLVSVSYARFKVYTSSHALYQDLRAYGKVGKEGSEHRAPVDHRSASLASRTLHLVRSMVVHGEWVAPEDECTEPARTNRLLARRFAIWTGSDALDRLGASVERYVGSSALRACVAPAVEIWSDALLAAVVGWFSTRLVAERSTRSVVVEIALVLVCVVPKTLLCIVTAPHINRVANVCMCLTLLAESATVVTGLLTHLGFIDKDDGHLVMLTSALVAVSIQAAYAMLGKVWEAGELAWLAHETLSKKSEGEAKVGEGDSREAEKEADVEKGESEEKDGEDDTETSESEYVKVVMVGTSVQRGDQLGVAARGDAPERPSEGAIMLEAKRSRRRRRARERRSRSRGGEEEDTHHGERQPRTPGRADVFSPRLQCTPAGSDVWMQLLDLFRLPAPQLERTPRAC